MIEAMKELTDVFAFSENMGSGNLYYLLANGQSHTRMAACDYLYDTLLLLYPGTGGDSTEATAEKKSLVAYFAYSENMGDTSDMTVDAISSASINAPTANAEGNLQVMAQEVVRQTGADVFHIRVREPYDPDYATMLPRAIEELESKNDPALEEKVENLADYDVIYLGTPIWAGQLPPAIHTFLAENDLSGKKVVLLGIHLGSGLGGLERELKELAPGIELVNSFTVRANTANADAQEQFSQWLKDLQMND